MSKKEHEPKEWTEEPEKVMDKTTVGQIPEDWKSARLSNLSKSSLYGINESAIDEKENTIPFLRVTNLREKLSGLTKELKYLSKEKVTDKRILNKNEMLFARSGSIGKTYLHSDGEFTYGGYIIKYNINEDKILPKYLLQFTKSPMYWNWVRRVSRGGVQSNISTDEYDDLLVPLPPRDEQERIASVLYSVDELIGELSDKRDNLQETKQGLMQDLLTGNKRVKENKTEEYENKTVFNKVPSDWDLSSLDNNKYFEVKGSGIDEFEGNKTYISTGVVEEREILDDEGYVTYEDRPSRANLDLNEDEVLFAKMKDSVKVVKGDKNLENNFVFSTGFIRINPNENFNQEFLVQILLSEEFNKMKDRLSTGSTQEAINLSTLSSLKVPVPPIDEQERIASVLYTVDEMIKNVEDKIECLEELKQGLMQDLLTGNKRTPRKLEKLEEIKSHKDESK